MRQGLRKRFASGEGMRGERALCEMCGKCGGGRGRSNGRRVGICELIRERCKWLRIRVGAEGSGEGGSVGRLFLCVRFCELSET